MVSESWHFFNSIVALKYDKIIILSAKPNNDSEKRENSNAAPTTAATNQLDGLKNPPSKIRTQYMREQLISQMGAMLDQGATCDQICATLKISQSTFYRWHDLLAEQQRKILNERFEKEILVNLRNCYNMMSKSINILGAIENNDENHVFDRVEAGKLKNQLGLARIKLLREGPRALIKDLPAVAQRTMGELSSKHPELPDLQPFEDVKTGYDGVTDQPERDEEEEDDNNNNGSTE